MAFCRSFCAALSAFMSPSFLRCGTSLYRTSSVHFFCRRESFCEKCGKSPRASFFFSKGKFPPRPRQFPAPPSSFAARMQKEPSGLFVLIACLRGAAQRPAIPVPVPPSGFCRPWRGGRSYPCRSVRRLRRRAEESVPSGAGRLWKRLSSPPHS